MLLFSSFYLFWFYLIVVWWVLVSDCDLLVDVIDLCCYCCLLGISGYVVWLFGFTWFYLVMVFGCGVMGVGLCNLLAACCFRLLIL